MGLDGDARRFIDELDKVLAEGEELCRTTDAASGPERLSSEARHAYAVFQTIKYGHPWEERRVERGARKVVAREAWRARTGRR